MLKVFAAKAQYGKPGACKDGTEDFFSERCGNPAGGRRAAALPAPAGRGPGEQQGRQQRQRVQPNPGEVTVSWDAPSDAPDDYRVTWKKSAGKWTSYKNENTVEGGNAFPTGTSHTVSNMEEGTAYKVRVRSRYHDTNGNVEQSGPGQQLRSSRCPSRRR